MLTFKNKLATSLGSIMCVDIAVLSRINIKAHIFIP